MTAETFLKYKKMTKIKDNCVLITGGASGIGRIMGRMALEKGAKSLIIWDDCAVTRSELALRFGILHPLELL